MRRLAVLPIWLVLVASVSTVTLVSVSDEIAIGRQAQQEVRKQVPALNDRAVVSYVASIGRQLAARAGGPKYPYSFSVADYKEINAFALPGGPVWIHRGVITAATNESQLAGVVAHEVAHQWFYALVGNDQGRDPWLDEGLASYAEYVQIGTLVRHERESIPSDAAGHAGDPMTYWDRHQSSYYLGVYSQSATAVARLGTVDEVDCALRQYVARNAFRIATPVDLLDALSTVFPDAADRLAPYGLHP